MSVFNVGTFQKFRIIFFFFTATGVFDNLLICLVNVKLDENNH